MWKMILSHRTFFFTISPLNLNQPPFSHPPFHIFLIRPPTISHSLTKPSIPLILPHNTHPTIPSLNTLPTHMVGNHKIHQSHHQTSQERHPGERISLLMYCTSILQLVGHFKHTKPFPNDNSCNHSVYQITRKISESTNRNELVVWLNVCIIICTVVGFY